MIGIEVIQIFGLDGGVEFRRVAEVTLTLGVLRSGGVLGEPKLATAQSKVLCHLYLLMAMESVQPISALYFVKLALTNYS